MVNDLIFPILPREGKVPVTVDDRVKKIDKSSETKGLSEEERQEHDEERRVTEKAQEERHQGDAKQESSEQDDNEPAPSSSVADSASRSAGDNTDADSKKDSKGIKHLDIYI
ncbi:hypothetical protein [Alteromonas sp. C1M14]|uniref:hypothetical protein n=1 Tax=Alteromonas sp. C1M14 TaxID=2841567 RepID=UPI001C08057E|nr:hypothetical protein [Alteromonas sp. C1M14]MBU2979797.1 hypothetical protein [Alteromonas sp. C1M14]